MQNTEPKGRAGGRARAEKLTPAERKQISRRAYLASTAGAVVKHWKELTEEQRRNISDCVTSGGNQS